jgi:hypothetical protein
LRPPIRLPLILFDMFPVAPAIFMQTAEMVVPTPAVVGLATTARRSPVLASQGARQFRAL